MPSEGVNSLAIDNNNNVWIGTEGWDASIVGNGGLVKFNGSNNMTIYNKQNSSILDNDILSIAGVIVK